MLKAQLFLKTRPYLKQNADYKLFNHFFLPFLVTPMNFLEIDQEYGPTLSLEESLHMHKHNPHSVLGAAQFDHNHRWESSSVRGKRIPFTSTAHIYPDCLSLPGEMIYRCWNPTSAASAPCCCWFVSAFRCEKRWALVIVAGLPSWK